MEIDTKAIRARCDAATPGPWESANKSVRVSGTQQTYSWGHEAPTGRQGGICNCLGRGYGGTKNNPINVQATINADFIAHARADIPALLSELDRLNKIASDYGVDIETLLTLGKEPD